MSIHHMQAHRKVRYAIIIIKLQPKHCSPKIEPVKGTGQQGSLIQPMDQRLNQIIPKATRVKILMIRAGLHVIPISLCSCQYSHRAFSQPISLLLHNPQLFNSLSLSLLRQHYLSCICNLIFIHYDIFFRTLCKYMHDLLIQLLTKFNEAFKLRFLISELKKR